VTPLRDLLESIVALTKSCSGTGHSSPSSRPSPARCRRHSGRTGPSSCASLSGSARGSSARPLPLLRSRGHSKQPTRPTLADFLAPIEEAAGAAAAAAAKHRVAEFGVSFAFDLKNPGRSPPSKQQAAASVEEIDATTRDDLTRILTQGMEEGYNYQQVARAIAAKYDEYAVPITRPATSAPGGTDRSH